MKKSISCLIILFLFIFIGISNVEATNLSVSADSVKVGKSITVTISDFTEGNSYKFDFTEGYFDVSSNTCGNRSEITTNCELALTVKSSLSLTENKEVTLSLTEIAEKDETKSKNVTITANKTTTKPTSQPASQTTTTTTTPTKSSNANLKSIDIKGDDNSDVVLEPSFSASVYDYSATVFSTISKVTIEAVMEDSRANMVISPNYYEELVAGENNKMVITVTAEDGSQKSYNLNIKREALEGNAIIKELQISEYPELEFQEDIFKYVVKIASDVNKLSINYIVENENILVDVTGNENLKDGSIVRLLVTAPDESKKEYTLTIEKEKETNDTVSIKEEKNPLIIISLSLVAAGLITAIIIVAVKKH